METINLGAVLFALLLIVWLVYAVPRIAERRDLLGQTHAADRARDSSTVRELLPGVRSRRRPIEGNHAMSTSRLLSRPADPTLRPRFEEPGTPRIELTAPAAVDLATRTRRVLRTALLALVGIGAVLVLGAVLGPVPWIAPVLAILLAAALGALLVRSEGVARERARRESAHRESTRRDTTHRASTHQVRSEHRPAPRSAAAAPVARAEREEQSSSQAPSTVQVVTDALPALPTDGARAREWTPRPVPRPAYAMRGEVEDLASRHDVHRRSVLERTTSYESADLEEVEARSESVEPLVEDLAPAVDLDLDTVLARRRGA